MAYPYDEEDKRAALTQGLLAAGLAALGARKGSEYNAFAQAGLLGLGGYNTSLRDATNAREQQAALKMRQEQYAMQKAQWEEQQRQARAQQAAAAGAFTGGNPAIPGGEAEPREGGMTPGLPAYGGQFNPQAYISSLQQQGLPMQAIAAVKEYAPKRVAPDAPKPEHFTGPSLAKFAQTGDWGVLEPIQKPQEKWREIGKTPSGQMLMENEATGERKAVGTPPAVTNVSVKNFAETEEDKAIGKARGELFTNINMGSQRAQSKITSLNAIKSLMSDVDTSPLTPAGNAVAGVLKGFGVEIDPKLPRKQAAEALMNKLALESRSTADGGGMPGAMSDKDREFLMGMNPSMSQTKEGRDLLIQVQIRLAKREQEIAQWAREYRAQNGRFDEGFQDYMAQKSAQSPLFADLAAQSQAAPGGVVDFNALRKRQQGK